MFPFTRLGLDSHPRSKILRYFLGFGPAFVILSISVEGVFYSVFSACLVTWIEVERRIRTTKQPSNSKSGKEQRQQPSASLTNYTFQPDDTRIAVVFLFFVQIAFFGTGKYVSFLLPHHVFAGLLNSLFN